MTLLECTTNHHKLLFYLNKQSNKEQFENSDSMAHGTCSSPVEGLDIISCSNLKGYLFYISADQYYGEWVELFADGYNDTDIEVITHDLRVLLEELEFFAQWMVRDAEDLVHPWVNYTSREVMDSYVFNYTFAAGEIIEITGQTTFRTYKIVEEAYYVSMK